MPPRKNQAAPPAQFEIGSVYEQEVEHLNEDLRRQAVLSTFAKIQPTNRTTVEQFLGSLKQHKEFWSVVSGMGIVDFADAINDGRRLRDQARGRQEPKAEGRRTRLNESQKQALKLIVGRILSEAKDGLNRAEIAKQISAEQAMSVGVNRAEMANKLRQPLAELVSDSKIHTVGEKRLMKYVYGAGPKNRKA